MNSPAAAIVSGALFAIPLSFALMPLLPGWDESMERAAIERKTQEHQQQLADDERLTKGVAECAKALGPWKCFEKLAEMDDDHPLDFGGTRTSRLISISPAIEVLSLCDLPRKVDCANQMIKHGYNASEVSLALRKLP